MEKNKCTCVSAYQDSKYGAGVRLFTKGVSSNACTVCGKNSSGVAKRKK